MRNFNKFKPNDNYSWGKLPNYIGRYKNENSVNLILPSGLESKFQMANGDRLIAERIPDD